ncbi:MAG: hypothetical protein UY81_C0013G0002 [Candidatus Giovannonibacteria bacterium GW2011_GWA2_53_7]|uniref:SbsA Ig-like domain-containing protein n=1 Tax=Candidatus Giovannonibacteria bacterium GW2011_GWA2_53_7 TaxID=1618650 RepID=A0A0G2AV77_9BACT|nr:MAG: hypothetical protein UY81_C0013G0002 [Candidatus Giovannonibacteria bacterium GW2011_GWA2_53_7]
MDRSHLKRLVSGLIAVFVLAVVLHVVPSAFAQIPMGDLNAVGASGIPTTDLRIIVAKLIRFVIGALGVLLLCVIVYAGILYMFSRGEKDKIDKARKIIRNAIIGMAIVLSSYIITTFVLSALLRAAGFGQNVTTGSSAFIEPLSGSLGVGIIQDHYPPRGAADIPRNTKIIVTFKEPMFLDSLLQPGTYDPEALLITGQMNANNVRIYRTADNPILPLVSTAVNVAVTSDLKTFVFDPVGLLGSPLEPQNYGVLLSPNILKLLPDLTTTVPAFPPPFADGYLWGFQISTVVDITPPQIQSFIPSPSVEYARNILVQVNFNEAVDPTATTGIFQQSVNPSFNFDNLQVRNETAAGALVEGTYVISNGYKTVEFITFDQCGVNACGGDIFCLPGGAEFTLFVRAAPLGTEPPQAVFGPTGYVGVADVAGNSMDGGGEYALLKDFIAQGPPTTLNALSIDNFWSDFSTNMTQNTERPHVNVLLPSLSQPDVSVDQDVEITFSEPMRISSLSNVNIGIAPRPFHEMWYWVGGENILDPTTNQVGGTIANMEHGLFRDYEAGDPVQSYYPIINNEVTTAYQICFYPAYGPPSDCAVTSAQPSCCNGVPSAFGTCPLPTP